MVPALYSENQGNSWTCQGCSLWAWCCLGIDPPLSNAVHDSYNTRGIVWLLINTCIIVLRPLHHWWCPWFRLFIPKTRVTAEYVQGVVCGNTAIKEVIHLCQSWSMTHIKCMEQWESVSIPVSSSLNHNTTDEVHGSRSWIQYPG